MRFADPIDAAADLQQQIIDRGIANAKAKQRELLPKGYCYNCSEELNDLRLFCDTDCAHDHERLSMR